MLKCLHACMCVCVCVLCVCVCVCVCVLFAVCKVFVCSQNEEGVCVGHA